MKHFDGFRVVKPYRAPKYQPWHVTNVTVTDLDISDLDDTMEPCSDDRMTAK